MVEKEVKDFGTPELHKRLKIEKKNGMARVYAQLPIDLYREKGIISEEQWSAGNRLSYIFVASQLMRSPNSSNEAGVSLCSLGELSGSERAEIEYKAAARAVSYKFWPLVRNVCCFHDETIWIIELRDGLDELGRFFQKYREENKE